MTIQFNLKQRMSKHALDKLYSCTKFFTLNETESQQFWKKYQYLFH